MFSYVYHLEEQRVYFDFRFLCGGVCVGNLAGVIPLVGPETKDHRSSSHLVLSGERQRNAVRIRLLYVSVTAIAVV
jgi:hypothetical protein